ncbi:MAG: Inner rane symporter YicJ [Verrucomicrobiota bacterium]
MSKPTTTRLPKLLSYACGEGANSLVMNGVFAFALIYYTKALGLDPFWAGIALSISIFSEAIAGPLMGHFSDTTRSRWGRRHPYLIGGGLMMVLCGYLIWAVPQSFRGHPWEIFWYLLVINLLLQTGVTMFFVPYMALGFELCTDDLGRSRLQAIRLIFNLTVNFAGPAMAWTWFFKDQGNLRGTTVAANYQHMGTTFALASAVFVVILVAGTWSSIKDTRQLVSKADGHWIREFYRDLSRIVVDPNLRWVIVFIFATCFGTAWVSALQIFVYDDFMKIPAHEKTIAHGSTMVGMALGAFFSMGLAKRFDKKSAVILGGLISVMGNGMLGLLFLTGIVRPGGIVAISGHDLPLSLGIFVVLYASYWLGIGIMLPNVTAMVADVAEIHQLRTGIKKEGSYSAVFSLSSRLAGAIGLMAAGYALHFIGYQVLPQGEAVTQSEPAIWRLGLLTFVGGTLVCLLALLAIRKHSITRDRLEKISATAGLES